MACSLLLSFCLTGTALNFRTENLTLGDGDVFVNLQSGVIDFGGVAFTANYIGFNTTIIQGFSFFKNVLLCR